MRILSVVTRHYYGQPRAIEPMFVEFTEPLRELGHHVDTFDHVLHAAHFGLEGCGRLLVDQVRGGGYDLVFYQTGGRDFVTHESIADARRYAPIVAWNSDDDWQWDSYTSHIAPLFTWVITTYPHIYRGAKAAHPNLLLSQWGCLANSGPRHEARSIDFSFVGQVYRNRVAELRELRSRAGLQVRGLGALRVKFDAFNHPGFRRWMGRLVPATNRALAFDEVHAIWNRSRISYTPLGASKDATLLQIKGRVFQMGLSGALMLANECEALSAYYEPHKEFVPFQNLEDCVEKVKFYLRHETARDRIAQAYARRTRAEHLWTDRFRDIFRQTIQRDGGRRAA